MPNDVRDWTGQNLEQIVSVAGLLLGDVGLLSPDPDAVTGQVSGSGVGQSGAALASFKAAAGSTIAQVGAMGAATTGTSTAVTPPFGQATTAGRLLVARVTAGPSASEPTTAAAGWAKVVAANTSGGWVAIWAKPNCGSAEAAPQFTSNGVGTADMKGECGEWSGVATATPTDQTGSGSGGPGAWTLAAAAADVAFGDLVVYVSRWNISSGTLASFTDTYNNSAAAVDGGAVADSFHGSQTHFSSAIIPAARSSLPLGTRPWDWDAFGSSAPAAGSQASVVLAASAGKAYRLHTLSSSTGTTGAVVTATVVQILDGVTVKWQHYLFAVSGTDAGTGFTITGLALKGTAGNSMTAQFSAGATSVEEAVNVGAYLQ